VRVPMWCPGGGVCGKQGWCTGVGVEWGMICIMAVIACASRQCAVVIAALHVLETYGGMWCQTGVVRLLVAVGCVRSLHECAYCGGRVIIVIMIIKLLNQSIVSACGA
jgi:hypothetical protein